MNMYWLIILLPIGLIGISYLINVLVLIKERYLSQRATLTDEELIAMITSFEEKHQVEVVIACGPTDREENADTLLASYNVGEDRVYWSASPEVVLTSSRALGVTPGKLVRIILAHEFGHKDTPDYMNSMYRLGLKHWSEMEKEAWTLGVRYISPLDYPLYHSVERQVTERMNVFYERYYAS